MNEPTPEVSTLLAQREWVRQLAQSLVWDRSDVEDTVQDFWLNVLQHPPRGVKNLSAWVNSALVHIAACRRASAEARRRREQQHARPEAPETEVEDRVRLHRNLVNYVLELDESYRRVLLMRYFDGLPPRRIARQLGIPTSTVKTRLQRGREQLRDRITARSGGQTTDLEMQLAPLLAVPWLSKLGRLSIKTCAAAAATFAVFLAWPTSAGPAEANGPFESELAFSPGIAANISKGREAVESSEWVSSAQRENAGSAKPDDDRSATPTDIRPCTTFVLPAIEAKTWLRGIAANDLELLLIDYEANSLVVVDPLTGVVRRTVPCEYGSVLAVHGTRVLLSIPEGGAQVFDVVGLEEMRRLPMPFDAPWTANGLATSTEGQTHLLASQSATLRTFAPDLLSFDDWQAPFGSAATLLAADRVAPVLYIAARFDNGTSGLVAVELATDKRQEPRVTSIARLPVSIADLTAAPDGGVYVVLEDARMFAFACPIATNAIVWRPRGLLHLTDAQGKSIRMSRICADAIRKTLWITADRPGREVYGFSLSEIERHFNTASLTD